MALSECISKIDKTGLELIEHGITSFPIACYHDDLQRESVDWHWHEELELIVVSEGSAIIAVDGEKYIVNEGNGFLLIQEFFMVVGFMKVQPVDFILLYFILV